MSFFRKCQPGIATRALLLAAWLLAACVCHAGLNSRDQATRALELMVSDDPQAALLQSQRWEEQGLKNGDKPLQLKALRLRVMANTQLEDASKLTALGDLGLPLARELRDAEAECEFLVAKATALYSDGKYQEAQTVFDQAVGIAEKGELARAMTGILVSKAFMYGLQGRYSDEIELLLKAHQRYEDLGDADSARSTLSAVGSAYSHGGASDDDLRKALTYHEKSIAPGAEKHQRHDLSTVYFNISIVYQRLKDLPKAMAYLQKSLALSRELKDFVGEAFCNYRLGALAREAGKWADALVYVDKALPVLEGAGDATMVFNVHRVRARALAQLARRHESLEALAKADAIRDRVKSSALETHYLETAAEVYGQLGDFEKAYRHQVLLRDAEKRSIAEAKEKDAAEIRTHFEFKQKEAENSLLRAKERESEARRVSLVLAVILLLFVLGGLGWYLYRQGQQNRRFASLAMRDDLTGLPNRRSIVEFAQTQLRGSRLDSQNLCLVLLDIDNFKHINDECGHAVGDAVLTAFAQVCSQQLRAIDRLGRYGGEEFMLIMPGADTAQIPQVFTRLRLAVRQLRVEGVASGRQLTFSLGATAMAGPSDDLDKMTKRADDALYRAKQGGRDRYEVG